MINHNQSKSGVVMVTTFHSGRQSGIVSWAKAISFTLKMWKHWLQIWKCTFENWPNLCSNFLCHSKCQRNCSKSVSTLLWQQCNHWEQAKSHRSPWECFHLCQQCLNATQSSGQLPFWQTQWSHLAKWILLVHRQKWWHSTMGTFFDETKWWKQHWNPSQATWHCKTTGCWRRCHLKRQNVDVKPLLKHSQWRTSSYQN